MRNWNLIESLTAANEQRLLFSREQFELGKVYSLKILMGSGFRVAIRVNTENDEASADEDAENLEDSEELEADYSDFIAINETLNHNQADNLQLLDSGLITFTAFDVFKLFQLLGSISTKIPFFSEIQALLEQKLIRTRQDALTESRYKKSRYIEGFERFDENTMKASVNNSVEKSLTLLRNRYVNPDATQISPQDIYSLFSRDHELYGYDIETLDIYPEIILFWCCYSQARYNRTPGDGIMLNVTPQMVADAFSSGILNAIHTEDCPTGHRNYFVQQFVGIFPEINIIYDISELFVEFVKLTIAHHIARDCSKKIDAVAILHKWLDDGNMINDSQLETYQRIQDHLKQITPLLIEEFAQSNYEDPGEIEVTLSELTRYVNDMGTAGFHFIEMVSPTLEQLDTAWGKEYPQEKRGSSLKFRA